MKKTVFFDFGNVLIFFSHKRMCEQLAELLDIAPAKVYAKIFDAPLIHAYETGALQMEDLFNDVKAVSQKDILYHDFLYAISNIFEPNPAILPILEKLKGKGHELILLSNTIEPHYNFASSRFPHFQYFDQEILSYKIGMRKPDAAIFKKALLLSSASPENCFYADDLKENIRAAKKVGLSGHVYKSSEAFEEELSARGFL